MAFGFAVEPAKDAFYGFARGREDVEAFLFQHGPFDAERRAERFAVRYFVFMRLLDFLQNEIHDVADDSPGKFVFSHGGAMIRLMPAFAHIGGMGRLFLGKSFPESAFVRDFFRIKGVKLADIELVFLFGPF